MVDISTSTDSSTDDNSSSESSCEEICGERENRIQEDGFENRIDLVTEGVTFDQRATQENGTPGEALRKRKRPRIAKDGAQLTKKLCTHIQSADDTDKALQKRERPRVAKNRAQLRKKLRTHIHSVKEFNPQACSAQNAELERLKRLQLKQNFTEQIPSTSTNMKLCSTTSASPAQTDLQIIDLTSDESRANTSDPVIAMVDLTQSVDSHEERVDDDVVIIDSESDSDDTQSKHEHTPIVGEEGKVDLNIHVVTSNSENATPTKSGLLKRYRENRRTNHGKVLINVGHSSCEADIYLAPQIARVVKPH